MDKYQIKNDLIKGIIEGKYTIDQVKKAIQDLEAEYGEDFFDNYDVPREDKPWNRETLKKLETASLVGTCSKPFILHLAEVSDFVHEKERSVENSKKKGSILRIAVIVIIIIILIVGVILSNSKANSEKETKEPQAAVTQIDTQLIQTEESWMTI